MLVIFREDLSNPVTFEEKVDVSPYSANFSIKYNGKDNPQFSFKSKDKHYLIEYKRNEKYYLKYIYYAGIFIGLLIFINIVQLISSYKLKKDKQRLEKIVMERTQEIREKNIVLEQQKEEITVQNNMLSELNEELKQQNEEITTQRNEIETQRDLVTQQKERIEVIHRDLTDSIHYAERIQNAVLPREEYINEILNLSGFGNLTGLNYFILFKPRDIVSGDFYWFHKRGDWLLFTVVDCTGHGVPGAFMSMLGVSFLNEIVARTDIWTAAEVLNQMREYIKTSLQQRGKADEQKDGMDMAFCSLNLKTNELHFSGANNPLWIIRNNKNPDGLEEIKGDKMPIGIHAKELSFTNHVIQINKGDTIYLMSDGYKDQFGGLEEKRFMPKQLKKLLVKIQDKPLPEQKEILNLTFENWKGNHKQIDDVTILGLKI